MIRRHAFGEHPSGKRGQGRYLSLKEFEREYDIFRGKLAEGIDPGPSPGPDPVAAPQVVTPTGSRRRLRATFPSGYSGGTVGGLIADYIVHHGIQHLAPKTLGNYLHVASRYILPRLQKIPAADLGPQDVREVLTAVTKQAPHSTWSCKKILSAAYEWGIVHQSLSSNPTREVKVSVPRRKRSRWLTEEELRQFLGGLDQAPGQGRGCLYADALDALSAARGVRHRC